MTVSTSIFATALSTAALVKTYLGGDEHTNMEPVHSDAYDIDADDWNRIVAGLGEIALRLHYGNFVSYLFSHPNAAASQTDASLYRGTGGDTAVKKVVAPCAGSVVGLSILVESARSAGTLTLNWRKNGTNGTLALTINGTTTQKNYSMQLPGVETFVAGDELELVFTTDAAWAAGSTPSISADLIVALGS